MNLKPTRGCYDYNMIFINTNNTDEEILSVVSHELGHEFLTLHTNLGQLCWILNNLAYNDKNFKDSYEYLFGRINKNEEQFCLLLEIITQISNSNFSMDSNDIENTFGSQMRKEFGKNYPFFLFKLDLIEKNNFEKTINFFKKIFESSMNFPIPDLEVDVLKNKKKFQQLFEKSKINPKKKLKHIIKYCDEQDHEKIEEIIMRISEIFNLDTSFSNNFFSLRLDETNLLLDYRAEYNRATKEYKQNKDVPLFFEDIAISSTVAALFIKLSEEQLKWQSEDFGNRILSFSEHKSFNYTDEIKKRNEIEEIILNENQISFITPYDSSKSNYRDLNKFFSKDISNAEFKMFGKIMNITKNTVSVSRNYYCNNLNIQDIKSLYLTNNSTLIEKQVNILLRLNHTNSNFRTISRIKNTMKEVYNDWLNVFICNPPGQLQHFIEDVKRVNGDSLLKYIYSDFELSVIEIHEKQIRIFLLDPDISFLPLPSEDKAPREMNILVTAFVDMIYNGDVLITHLDNKIISI